MSHLPLYSISPIGFIRTPFKQKFGAPRQSGLASHAQGVLELREEFSMDSVRGLDEFDYIWLQFIFHQVLDEGYGQMVRPPRLGGKVKKGIFATRSPHRPNHLGLSLVRLLSVEFDKKVRIVCSGVDLVDGTPIIDIKPYLPHIESHERAASGFSQESQHQLSIVWLPECRQKLSFQEVSLVEEVLAQDPRPVGQYQRDKIFTMNLGSWAVHFRVRDTVAMVIKIEHI